MNTMLVSQSGLSPEGIPCMSDSPSRQEVKEMVEDAVEAKVETAVTKGIDKWMSKYELKPHHFVYLDAAYNKTLAGQNLLRKIVITTIVTAITLATFGS